MVEAEKEKVYESKVKQAGLFDFKEFYKFAHKWLKDSDFEVTEKNYAEKVKDVNSKDIEIEWDAKKKATDYFRYIINVKTRVLALQDVEVQEGGRKIKTNKGEVEVKILAELEKDYEHRWENNPFSKFLRGIYDRYVIKNRIDDHEVKLQVIADDFLSQIKSFLAIEGMR